MIVLGNLIEALAGLLNMVITLYVWVIIARAVISWVNADPYNPIVRTLCNLTDPVLYRLRQTLPMAFGGIDMSPIVALLILWFVRAFLVQSLYDIARAMQ